MQKRIRKKNICPRRISFSVNTIYYNILVTTIWRPLDKYVQRRCLDSFFTPSKLLSSPITMFGGHVSLARYVNLHFLLGFSGIMVFCCVQPFPHRQILRLFLTLLVYEIVYTSDSMGTVQVALVPAAPLVTYGITITQANGLPSHAQPRTHCQKGSPNPVLNINQIGSIRCISYVQRRTGFLVSDFLEKLRNAFILCSVSIVALQNPFPLVVITAVHGGLSLSCWMCS